MRIGVLSLRSPLVVIWAAPLHVARAELLIAIDKSAQQMIVSVDGFTRYVCRCRRCAGLTTRRRQFKPFRMRPSTSVAMG